MKQLLIIFIIEVCKQKFEMYIHIQIINNGMKYGKLIFFLIGGQLHTCMK